MYNNGQVICSDIEMMLEAFSTNSGQNYADFPKTEDHGTTRKSNVMRLPQEFAFLP